MFMLKYDMHLIVDNPKQTKKLAQRFAHGLETLDNVSLIVWLSGEMGVGKTAFVQGVLQASGWAQTVKSPTYTLVESYNIGEREIFHFDLYRINDHVELENIGFRDYLINPAIHFIEWAERMEAWLPKPDIHIRLLYVKGDLNTTDEKRNIYLDAHSHQGKQVLELCQ